LAIASFRLRPAAHQKLDFLVSTDQRCGRGAQRFEAALHRACAQCRPSPHRSGDALEVLGSEVLKVEEVARQFPRALSDDHRVRFSDAL
jgi:hypothetical protein